MRLFHFYEKYHFKNFALHATSFILYSKLDIDKNEVDID